MNRIGNSLKDSMISYVDNSIFTLIFMTIYSYNVSLLASVPSQYVEIFTYVIIN